MPASEAGLLLAALALLVLGVAAVLAGRPALGRALLFATSAGALLAVALGPPVPGLLDPAPFEVVVIDGSRSMGAGLSERLGRENLGLDGDGERLVVLAGADALVLHHGPAASWPERFELPAAALAPAFRADFTPRSAWSLVAERAAGRRVALRVLTDGGADAAALVPADGLPFRLARVAVEPLPGRPAENVALRVVSAPERARSDRETVVEVEVSGVVARPRALRVESGGAVHELALAPGPLARRLRLAAPPGARVLEARLAGHRSWDADPADDAIAVALVDPVAGARIAVLADRPERRAALTRRLEGAGSVVRELTAAEGLADADVAVVLDLDLRTAPPQDAEALARFARSGGGLLLAGARTAFGTGGWEGGPLDAVSPLRARPPDARRRILVALDRSGSMNREGRFDAAAHALAAVAGALGERDALFVCAFARDRRTRRFAGGEAEAVLDWVRALPRGGGTDLAGALDAVLSASAEDEEAGELVLVLSDARDPAALAAPARARAIAAARAAGRPVTVLWFDRDEELRPALEDFTDATGGELVAVDDFGALTRAFLDAATQDLVAGPLDLPAPAGGTVRIARLLRTARAPGAAALSALGPDLTALALGEAGAGRVAAAPLDPLADGVEPLFGTGGLRAFVLGLAARGEDAVATVRRERRAGETRWRVVMREAGARPASLIPDDGETAVPLHRVGPRTWEGAAAPGPGRAATVRVLGEGGVLLGRRGVAPPELHDAGRPEGEAARAALRRALEAAVGPASTAPPGGAALALAALLAFGLDLVLRRPRRARAA